MNKLYSIFFYIKNQYYMEFSTFHRDRLKEELKTIPEARLIENNDIHELWRVDI